MIIDEWKGTLSREDAIRIIDAATDDVDPMWECAVSKHYDEDTDTMPTIYQVMEMLGISEEEYNNAIGINKEQTI